MDREISFKELFAYVVEHTQKICLIALILAIIAVGYGLYSVRNEKTEEYEEDLALTIMRLEMIEENLQEQESYVKNSIYYGLNAYNKAESSITGYIDTGYEIMPDKTYQNRDMTPVLASSFAAIAGNDELIIEHAKDIIGKNEVETRFIRELFDVQANATGFFEIKVSYDDERIAMEIVHLLLESLTEKANSLSNPFKIHIMSEFTGRVIDKNLLNHQQAQINQIIQSKAEMEKIVEELNGIENSGSVLRYLIVGLAVGIFIGCLIFVCIFLMSDKINSIHDIFGKYPYQIYGVFPSTKKSKWHVLAKKIRGCTFEAETVEMAYDVVAANLAEIKDAFVIVGSSHNVGLAIFAEELGRRTGLDVVCGGNIIMDEQAILACKDKKNMLIVEKLGTSKLQDFELQIEKVKSWDKNILGIVLL